MPFPSRGSRFVLLPVTERCVFILWFYLVSEWRRVRAKTCSTNCLYRWQRVHRKHRKSQALKLGGLLFSVLITPHLFHVACSSFCTSESGHVSFSTFFSFDLALVNRVLNVKFGIRVKFKPENLFMFNLVLWKSPSKNMFSKNWLLPHLSLHEYLIICGHTSNRNYSKAHAEHLAEQIFTKCGRKWDDASAAANGPSLQQRHTSCLLFVDDYCCLAMQSKNLWRRMHSCRICIWQMSADLTITVMD